MNESVVEGCEKMDNTEGVGLSGSTSLGWSEIVNFLFLYFFDGLFGWLYSKQLDDESVCTYHF